MKALVLGGTGFIGRWIVRALVRRGTEVAVYHRGRTPAPDGVLVFTGDRRDLASQWPFIASWGPDAIIDVRCMTMRELNCILPVVKKSGARYVLVSSADVYRAFGIVIGVERGLEPEPITEKAPLRGRLYPYASQKPAPGQEDDVYDKIPIEEAIRREMRSSSVILRLPMVYGPGDHQRRLWPHLSRMKMERPWIILQADLATWKASRSFVGDVGEACALAALHPFASGQVYNIAEPAALTTYEWVQRIGSSAGWKGEIRIVERSRTPEWLDPGMNTSQPLVIDSSRMRDDLAFREVFDPEAAMRQTIEWELANPGPEPAVDELAREEALVAVRGRKKALVD